MKGFPYYKQYDQMDCGPTCLRMVAKHHGRGYTMDTLRQKSGINREGVSLLGISEAAEQIGFRTVGAKLTWQQLRDEAPLPCVVWWNQEHFVLVYKIKKNRVYVADPAVVVLWGLGTSLILILILMGIWEREPPNSKQV